ncbi:MAG: vWA domain-containing protein [Candidatus Acidiferrales bacterium]
MRTIPVVAMTRDGRVVEGLNVQNLRLRGIKATIENVTFDASPRRIILLLDISGSMDQKWAQTKEMAKAFLDAAPTDDLLALYLFAEKDKQVVPFTHDFASIRTVIDALPEPDSKPAKNVYGAKTYPGDALNAVLAGAGKELGFGDSVIFFSDGEFEEPDADTGKRSLDSLKAELGQRGIRVFLALALLDGPIPQSMWQDDMPRSLLVQNIRDAAAFMGDTGGYSFVPARFPGESGADSQIGYSRVFPQIGYSGFSPQPQVFSVRPVQERMAALNAAVHGTHRVQLQLDRPLRKRRSLQLELVNDKGKVLSGIFLFYPRNLYPDSDAH